MSYPAHDFSEKDPSAVLVYTIDWSAWLVADTISASTWTVPSGIVKDSDSNTTTLALIKVSGGTAGNYYDLTNRIVTTAGLTEERTVRIPVAQR